MTKIERSEGGESPFLLAQKRLVYEHKPTFRYLRRLMGVSNTVGYGMLPEINDQYNSFAALVFLRRFRDHYYLPSGRNVDFHPHYQELLMRPRRVARNQHASVLTLALPREQSQQEQRAYFLRYFDSQVAAGVFGHELGHHLLHNHRLDIPTRVSLVKLATTPMLETEIWEEIAVNRIASMYGLGQVIQKAVEFCRNFPGANREYYDLILDQLKH